MPGQTVKIRSTDGGEFALKRALAILDGLRGGGAATRNAS